MAMLLQYARDRLAHALDPRTDHSLHKVFLSAALETVGWSIITPGLPTLHAQLSLSSSSVGSISALISIIALASVVIQGMASDAMGRVKLLCVSSIAQLVGHVVLYFFAIGHFTSIPLFVVFRVLPSIFKCGMIVSQAYVCDWIYTNPNNVLDAEDRGLSAQQITTKHISTLMAYTNVGFIIGPILGGQLSVMHPSYPFTAGCAVFGINLLLLSQTQDPPCRADGTLSNGSAPPGDGKRSEDPEGGSSSSSSAELYASTSSFYRKPLPNPYQLKSSIRPRRNFSSSMAPAYYGGEFGPYLSSSLSSSSSSSSVSAAKSQKQGRSKQARSSLLEPVLPSLFWLLHVKFAFQVGNAIYESLFAQHLKDRLGTSPRDLGLLLGWCGLEAAFVNGVLVKFVLSAPGRTWPALVSSSVVQGVGLALWASCHSFPYAAGGAALIALASNTFLSLIQGLIARHSSDVASARDKEDAPSGSGSGSGAGRTFGLSTSVDRAARTVAPIIGALALQHYGLAGFALCAGSTGLYTAGTIVAWLFCYGQGQRDANGGVNEGHTD